MNQTWKNGKKTSFEPNFFPFDPNLGTEIFLWILPQQGIRNFCKLSLYAISRKTDEPNLRKLQKT